MVCLTVSCGRFVLFLCSAPSRQGLPAFLVFFVFFVFFLFLLSSPLPSCAPVDSGFLCFPAPGALGLGAPRSLPAPPLFFSSSLLRPPPPRFAVFFFPFLAGVFPLLHLPRGPLCCCFRALGLGALLCPPPFSSPCPFHFLFFSSCVPPFLVPPLCASLVSAFPLFPALCALGLGALSPPSPPAVSLSPFLVFCPPFCFFSVFFSALPLFPGSGALSVHLSSGLPGWVPPFFSECGPACGMCAARRGCRLGRVLLVLPCCFVRAGWCCVLLPLVAGCSLLGLVVGCCFPLACFGVGGPAWPRDSPPCCLLWFIVAPRSPVLYLVFCGSVLPCGRVLWCPAVRFAFFCGWCGAMLLLGAVCGALCFSLGGVLCPRRVPPFVRCWVWLPACRVVAFALAGAVCCYLWLPAVVFLWYVLPRLLLLGRVACCPAVCCGSLWCRFGLRCRWCLVLWCVAACSGASFGVLWCGGAALVCCGVLLCLAVFCGAVSPCGAVLLRCAVCFASLRAFVFPFKTIFCFERKNTIKKNEIILYPTHARRQAAMPRSLC